MTTEETKILLKANEAIVDSLIAVCKSIQRIEKSVCNFESEVEMTQGLERDLREVHFLITPLMDGQSDWQKADSARKAIKILALHLPAS